MAAPFDGERFHRLTRRWVVGAAAAAAVIVGAALVVAAPAGPPHASPTTATGILAATRQWAVAVELHGVQSAGATAGGPTGAAPVPLQLGSVACTADLASCIAVGGPFVARRTSGGRWTVRQEPSGVGFLTSVSCAGRAACLAVAQPSGSTATDLAMSTVDGGATWTARRLPPAVEGLSSVDCATASDCAAVGEGSHGAVVATTADGGSTWRVAAAPAVVGGLDAVSCVRGPAPTCMAVGWLRGSSAAAIAVLPAGIVVRAPAGVRALDSVTCPTSSTCFVGGFLTPVTVGSGHRARTRFPGALARTSDGGRDWSLLALPAAAGPVNALSCLGAAGCVAAGVSASPAPAHAGGSSSLATAGPPGMVLTTADGGGSWQVDELPSVASGIAGVACAAAPPAGGAADCVATAAGPRSSSLVIIDS